MHLPANRPRLARKKCWCRFLKCTVRYESHLVTIIDKLFQKALAICSAFSCHFFTFYAVRSSSMCNLPFPSADRHLLCHSRARGGHNDPR